jgi:AmmeMemoRadiSam system protein B
MDRPQLRPKLRKVERIALRRGEASLLVLRDPLALAEPLAIDADYGPLLDLLDGTRTAGQIRQSLLFGPGLDVEVGAIESIAADLAAQGWLDDDRFRERWAELHAEFLAADVRAPTLAGVLYPDDPGELGALLARTLPAAPRTAVAGIVAPHGPLDLVGAVLRETLVAIDPRELDFIVVLATDHQPGLLPYAVTDKAYATPLGEAACERAVIDALRRRVEWIDREEIRHRTGAALEWAVLYLQHVCGGTPPPIVPILCGATACGKDGLDPRGTELALALESVTDGARTFVWASAELSHVGPAYGRPAVEAAALAAIENRDRAVLDAFARGRMADLFAAADRVPGQGRPSGLPVLATLAELGGTRAQLRAYELAAVPGGDEGKVGLAGLHLAPRP